MLLQPRHRTEKTRATVFRAIQRTQRLFRRPFGNSQAVTLNVQNKSLINTLQRLEKQLERLDECESIGMWDFAAYFLGESASEAETAANMYRSLISGSQSGLEIAAVNTWTDERRVEAIFQIHREILCTLYFFMICRYCCQATYFCGCNSSCEYK